MEQFDITILFLEAISAAGTLSSHVLAAASCLLRCKPHRV